MSGLKALAAGNWKMNGTSATLTEIVDLMSRLDDGSKAACDVLICPPFTLISAMAGLTRGSGIAVGAQDCHAQASGAHTGDTSAEMLKDAGCTHVIVGHSERRANHGESDALVRAKAESVLAADLVAIICVGETEPERDAGKALDIVAAQLAGSIPDVATAATVTVAYEPVWAIGTGRTPTADDVAEMHAMIRAGLDSRFGGEGGSMRILYGGSVKPSNASELMGLDNVNGALVGGASLKAVDFDGIIDAYR